MKGPIILLTAVVLLCALLAGCSLSGRIAEARSDTGAKGQKPGAVASTLSTHARQGWRLGTPASYKNLTVFPVFTDESTSTGDLITLDQGLRSGKVKITELGADGRTHAIDRRQNLDAAEVNRLALTNNSGKPLVLIAGEMILGGKQDRIVGHDCIIEATNTPVPLDVFCVEHGRWSGGAAFGQSRGSANGSGGGEGSGAGSSARVEARAVAPMALPTVREKAQAKKSQSEVWGAVSETVTVTLSASSTGDLNSVYENKHVTRQLGDYELAFKDKLSASNIVGVVTAVGGKVISADVFANHSLFQAYWPKMLKSYALEAVSTKANPGLVRKGDAEAFLARAQGSNASSAHEGVYRLAENQSAADASFELEYVKNTPTLVHFNRVAKK